jgi:predicted TIM-barrel fold metal-dependent hydrolase
MQHAPLGIGARRLQRLAIAIVGGLAAACSGEDESTALAVDTDSRPLVEGAALDAHVHLMSQTLLDLSTGGGAVAPGADDLVARLDEAQILRAVVLSYGYVRELSDEALARAENDHAAAQVARYPDRLIGFCGINPLRAGAAEEIDRCVDELGLHGVKIHMANALLDVRLAEHAAALATVLDRARERDLPVLLHAGSPLGLALDSDAFLSLGGLIAERPELRLVLAHCTNDADRSEMEVWLAGLQGGLFNPDTLFVDTSSCLKFYADAPSAQKELIVWRLREWGIDHVLFGSDYDFADPVETPAEALATLRSYPFTPEELATLLRNDGSAWLTGAAAR